MDTVVRALGLAPKFVLVSQMLLVFSMGPELDAEGPRGQWTILNLTASESESEVTQSCRLLATLWTAAYEAPPSMGFSRQEYWSVLPS